MGLDGHRRGNAFGVPYSKSYLPHRDCSFLRVAELDVRHGEVDATDQVHRVPGGNETWRRFNLQIADPHAVNRVELRNLLIRIHRVVRRAVEMPRRRIHARRAANGSPVDLMEFADAHRIDGRVRRMIAGELSE